MSKLNDADKIYLGSSLASAVYLGATKVWPATASAPTFVGAGTAAPANNDRYNTSLTTSTVDVAAGSLIVLIVSYSDNSTYLDHVSDNAGNAYTKAGQILCPHNYNITTGVYYCLNSAAKTGLAATMTMGDHQSEVQSLIMLVFAPATWSYDATGSNYAQHAYDAGPMTSSDALTTAGKGVMVSGVCWSGPGGAAQTAYFSDATLAAQIQATAIHGPMPTAAGYKFNTSAVSSHTYAATLYNTSGGSTTSNFEGNTVFASFTYA